MIENYAMQRAESYYRSEGYKIDNVSANSPYDLLIKKDGVSRFVEVKGMQAEGKTIILTKNEVELSRTAGDNMELFIIHSIKMNKKSVKKDSGIVVIIKPWKMKKDNLTPISYTYKL